MCLIVNRNYHLDGITPLISEKEIVVYKVLLRKDPEPKEIRWYITSPYVESVNEVPKYITPHQFALVDFDCLGRKTLVADGVFAPVFGQVYKGIHAYTTYSAAKTACDILAAQEQEQEKPVIVLATIPLETEFFVGEAEDIVSKVMTITNTYVFKEPSNDYTFENWWQEYLSRDINIERLTKKIKEVLLDGFPTAKKIWKPTEGQLAALKKAVDYGTSARGEIHEELKSLLEDLTKL